MSTAEALLLIGGSSRHVHGRLSCRWRWRAWRTQWLLMNSKRKICNALWQTLTNALCVCQNLSENDIWKKLRRSKNAILESI